MNRFFWRILLQILLLQHIICFNINNASYSILNSPKKKKLARLETVAIVESNFFGNYFQSNDRNEILTILVFVNFFFLFYLAYFMYITAENTCVWLRHTSCPNLTTNSVSNFLNLSPSWQAIFLLIGLFTFCTIPKIQIWMEKIPMIISIDNLIELEPRYLTTLKIFYRFVLSLQMQTKNKLALNTDVFSQLNDYRGWEEFWPEWPFNKIPNKNIQQLIKLCFIWITLYVLETISESFEQILPDNQNFHEYFTNDFDSAYNFIFIIFVKKIGFKMFSEQLIFVYLPKFFPYRQFILTFIKNQYISLQKKKQIKRPFFNLCNALLKKKTC